jgi:hypothetical protein
VRWPLLLLVSALAGCSGFGDSGDAPELPPSAVREAPAVVRGEGTFAFSATYTREVPDKDDERYLTFAGAVDVARGSGGLEADLASLLTDPKTNAPVFERIELSWTREELRASVEGKRYARPRAQARASGGLIGRLPDEPAALVELLRHAEDVRRVGEDEIDGRAVVRFACSVDARRAGSAGVPAEVAAAFAQSLYGPKLPLEVWLDADGLPRRLEYVIRLKPLRSGGKQILPERLVRGTYELSAFGSPVGG